MKKKSITNKKYRTNPSSIDWLIGTLMLNNFLKCEIDTIIFMNGIINQAKDRVKDEYSTFFIEGIHAKENTENKSYICQDGRTFQELVDEIFFVKYPEGSFSQQY